MADRLKYVEGVGTTHSPPSGDRYAAARRAAAAYKRKARARDLDPAKRARDLAALPPETRQRVEGFERKTHL